MPTFFIDRCLNSRGFIAKLKSLGMKIITIDEHFGKDEAANLQDVEWLAECGKQDWAVITKDSRITRNATEFDALVRNKLVFFSISNASGTMAKNGELVEKYHQKMIRVASMPGPRVYFLTQNGMRNETKIIGKSQDPRRRDR